MPTLTIDHIKWLLLTSTSPAVGRNIIEFAIAAIAYGIVYADSDTRDLLDNLVYHQSNDVWVDCRDTTTVTHAYYEYKKNGF